ncbi:MAG: PhoH family protein [Methylobacteriaceae bacterium]|jgi:phosphate starvation-inducible PhoH-like protein|nr:PhoH family protein [Methylobacteriaceae bacterium]
MTESDRESPIPSRSGNSDRLSDVEILVPFEENSLASVVFGRHDQNLAFLERRFGLMLTAIGNHVAVRGPVSACDTAKHILNRLYQRAAEGARSISFGDIDGVIREYEVEERADSAMAQLHFPGIKGFASLFTRKRGTVKARTETQSAYIEAMRDHELVFAEGPAGTGKTWLAVGFAVFLLEQGTVDRIILSRPAVEAGERLGFLPGDMREKVDPYLRPIYDALHDFMDVRHVERGLQSGMIEIAPLAFMRGRTLSNSVIILDEAQNTSSMQMKMFLTRLGEGSRMVVTGDTSQIDLPPGQKSGLVEACALLKNIDGVAHVHFHAEDVVRHDLVRRIVNAYDAARVHRQSAALRDTESPVPS